MSRRHDGKNRGEAYEPLGPRGERRPGPRRKPASDSGGGEWLWGRHAVEAALANPRRRIRRLLVAEGRPVPRDAEKLERLDTAALAALLPAGVAHQGYALLADPPDPTPLETLAEPAEGVLLLLDGVTDPQNVGAVFRSAAAFGARGVILQERHAPPLSAALAKAAAGALDAVPHARVVNLSRALETLSDMGWRAVGLAGDIAEPLDAVLDASPTVLVLGSEGEGLRRLVAEHCDVVASIPMPGGFESLNVSAAAAIALYEATRARRAGQSTGERS